METKEILQAVKALLDKAYPGELVYEDHLPKGFVRPSFLLDCPKEETADAAAGLVRRTVTLQITCFVEQDDYSDSSRTELNARKDAVSTLFAKGFLRVGTRALHVIGVAGLCEFELSQVSVTLSFLAARPGLSAKPQVPVAESFELDIRAPARHNERS